MSLDIKMFMAGELEVILSKRVSATEKLGRLKLLKKMMYFANIYEWKALLKFYAAWVRRIEIGLSQWSDNSAEIKTPMLACFPLRNKTFSKKEMLRIQDAVWWCPDFNKQSCSLGSSHQKVIKGQFRAVRHFCSACYRTDKVKLEHPMSSSAIYIYIYIGTLLRHSLTIIQRFDFYWLCIKDEIKENKDRQKKYIIIHKIYKCRIKMRRKEKYVSNL